MAPQTRRSKAQASQTSSSTVTDVQDSVSISFIFVDKTPPATCTDSLVITLSRPQFNGKIQHCVDSFSAEILQAFKFDVKSTSVTFWKPIKPILQNDVEYFPGEDVPNLRDKSLFSKLLLGASLSDQLGNTIQNEDSVHLVVSAQGSYRPASVPAGNHEAQDLHTPLRDILPEIQRFNDICSLDFKSPSTNARSKDYASTQADPLRALYDGRTPDRGSMSTVAPPIQIYHPVFGKFIQQLTDSSVLPSPDDLRHTQDLMMLLSTIMTVHEAERNDRIRDKLTEILGEYVSLYDDKTTVADGVITISLSECCMPVFVLEISNELGGGGSDATTQVGFSARKAYLQAERKGIRDKCCCPLLMLAGGGPWLAVMGSVFTDKIIVQRLTDMMWLSCSSTEEDARVNRFARVLMALRTCISNLKSYYQHVDADLPTPSPDLSVALPRFYPYPTRFTDKDVVVDFEYVKALEEDATCVVFKARTVNEAEPRDIVVKFVTKYGEDAHIFLANAGHAPNLLYLGPLPDQGAHLAPPTTPELVPGGLSVGPMQMVVMDYVAPREGYPKDAREQLQVVLRKLHGAGYVFGDLRNQNILFDEHGKAKLIDFDWAGSYEREPVDQFAGGYAATVRYARYPLNISRNIQWAAGVEYLAPIRPEHDLNMLTRLDFR